jgi:hypothetical protein
MVLRREIISTEYKKLCKNTEQIRIIKKGFENCPAPKE